MDPAQEAGHAGYRLKPLVIAHRGASGRETENSLAAFRLSKELGADAVELDVHATSDGRLVVFHDEQAGGLTIAHSPFDQVRRHRIGNGEPVPTLDESLDVILSLGMLAFVEVKSLNPRFDDQLLAAYDRCTKPDCVAIHSFDHRVIRRLGKRRPGLPLGILLSGYIIHAAVEMKSAMARAVWQRYNFIDRDLTSSVGNADGTVYAWTVDDPAEMRRLIEVGVGGVCSNHPDRARSVVDSLPS